MGFDSYLGLLCYKPLEPTKMCLSNNADLLGHGRLEAEEKRTTRSRWVLSAREMGVTKEQLESSLTSKMNPSYLEVMDTSGGCGASFVIEIVSEQFEGKRLLERHRMVNGALSEEMKQIHALSIRKALTPDQWKQQQQPSAIP